MTTKDEWSLFLEHLMSNAIDEHKNSKEYAYRLKRQHQIDEFLTTNLTPDQKDLVEEVLFEFGMAAERETEVVYRQGLKDCVWLLKSLGVLA